MRYVLAVAIMFCSLAGTSAGQPPAFTDPLLDRLAGTWVLRGEIARRATTHDVTAEWVLGHQYLRLHEVSRETDAKKQPAYEAIVFIGWDPPSGQHTCLWLDSTGSWGLSGSAIGHARKSGDTLPFVFKDEGGNASFNNTFAYDKTSDSWTWLMDNVEKGKPAPFGRVKLTRR